MDGSEGVVPVGRDKGDMGTVGMGTNGNGRQAARGTRAPTLMVFVCSLRPLRVLMALSASLGSE